MNIDKVGTSTVKKAAIDAAAGAAAGFIVGIMVCPLDVIKTRLQVDGISQAMSGRQRGTVIFRTLQDIVKREGLRGIYRGLSPTLIAYLPNWTVNFLVYENLKSVLQSSDGKLSAVSNMEAAAIAGASTAIVTNPLWVVRTRLMTQGIKSDVIPYKTVFSALARIYREERLHGLYSGIVPSLLGVSHVVIQFPIYEMIKKYMAEKGDTSTNVNTIVAISISKIIASVMTYPHEVIRSKLQDQGKMINIEAQYSGVIDCTKKVFRKEGFNGFYHGCATNLLKIVPQAIVTFTTFELVQAYLKQVMLSKESKEDKNLG